jgi:type IX secretion system PorP/SprF family membrane protein
MKRIITIALLFVTLIGFSQQEPQFSLFWKNYSLFNPANTAVSNTHYANVSYRLEHLELTTNPQNVSANYEMKIKKINSGVGLGYLNQKIGLSTSQKMYLNYAYHLKLPKINGSISIGLSANYQIMKFTSSWNGPTTGYNSVLDPSLPKGASEGRLNVNSGLLFKTKKIEIGVSLTQINEPRFDKLNFSNSEHIFGMASYKFQLIKGLIYQPTIYFKSDYVAGVIELNNRFILKDKYFIGLMYRHDVAVGVQLGATLFTNFQIAYAYDLLTSPLTQYAKGGYHEMTLSFKIK